MKLESITIDELLAELGQDATPTEGFLTTPELAAAWNVSIERVRKILRLAQAAGRMHHRREPRQAITGRMQPVDVYRITPAAKKGKK
jgi:hypothetical protein